MKVVISSGHGSKIQGAVGPSPWGLHEHEEAVRVVNETAAVLRQLDVEVTTYEDTVSTNQDDNLERIVSFHNAQGSHDLDISVHFNSATFSGSNWTSNPVGCEVFHYSSSSSGRTAATNVVNAICTASGLKNRGAKTASLYFTSNTRETAILIEVCFVNSKGDVAIYTDTEKFSAICSAIAGAIAGQQAAPGPEPEPPSGELFAARGKVSYFGGPEDTGVSSSEMLAFISDIMQAPQLFLPYQPAGTTGLARRLNPWTPYCAARWDYAVTSKSMLRDSGQLARVTNMRTGNFIDCWPADWGPHSDTGRVLDVSPLVMEVLDLQTDMEVEVSYPVPS